MIVFVLFFEKNDFFGCRRFFTSHIQIHFSLHFYVDSVVLHCGKYEQTKYKFFIYTIKSCLFFEFFFRKNQAANALQTRGMSFMRSTDFATREDLIVRASEIKGKSSFVECFKF